ncbi:unnamed protein product [Phaedon cochleariae]|uniref:CCHC-type domain-containing protein n=1 Tax=Phaedon cochleariae TaxID=80249 RepID=A0A9N9SAU3_PHACE|nr:unnamed protein product [Phaedon cochleariae]
MGRRRRRSSSSSNSTSSFSSSSSEYNNYKRSKKSRTQNGEKKSANSTNVRAIVHSAPSRLINLPRNITKGNELPVRRREPTSGIMLASETPTHSESTTTATSDRVERLEALVEKLLEYQSHQSSVKHRTFIKADCIPEFIPGNPILTSSRWIEKIEQLGCINNWDEATMIFHMQSRLAGLARKWYDNLKTYQMNWLEWKDLVVKTFPDHHDFANTLKRMMERYKLKSESWECYYFEKMELLGACEISGKKAVSCLIDGIRDQSIQAGARAGRYESPDALYAEYLSTLRYEDSHAPSNSSGPTKYSATSSRIRDDRKHRKKSTAVTMQKCYNCKQKGHFSNECLQPKVECFKCKRLGHVAKDC